MSDYLRFKKISELIDSGKPEQIRSHLRGLQAHFIALHDEVDRLHARIGNFEKLLSIPQKVIEENGFTWIETEQGRQGPFCPFCHEDEGSFIHLLPQGKGWTCPCCSAEFLPEHQVKAHILPFHRQLGPSCPSSSPIQVSTISKGRGNPRS